MVRGGSVTRSPIFINVFILAVKQASFIDILSDIFDIV